MAMQASSSHYGLDESLSRADQELFSIFLQYPEATLDDGRILINSSSHEPSQRKTSLEIPSKHQQDQALVLSTLLEDRRKPSASLLRRSDLGIPAFDGEWAGLKALLETSTLPDNCLQYYSLLGETIMNLGADLFSTVRPGRTSDLIRLGSWLLRNITYSCTQAELQVKAIASLKDLAPFTVKPKPSQIWSTYSQRVRMIASTLALPSKQELTIIQCLVFLYNTCVYEGLLSGLTNRSEGEHVLNDIYDAFMSWLFSYKQWCRGMQELKVDYLQNLTNEFGGHPEAQDEYNDLQQRLRASRSALSNPLPDTAEMTENIVKTLNLSARRPGPESSRFRSRTRLRREFTV